MPEIDIKTILYITIAIGGIMGGILTALNKVRYVTRTEFCRKIEEIKQIIKNADDKRENARTEITERLLIISEFMGEVKGFMRKP